MIQPFSFLKKKLILETLVNVLQKYKWWILLILCLVSRMITTIYYFEDPDSLRFALSTQDFDITRLQPHFPGYPVFCALAKVLSFLTGSFAIGFSLIGTASIFLIIFQMHNLFEGSPSFRILLWILLFFNPLLWIMSNRYMPDLMGVAICIWMFKFYYKPDAKSVHLFFFLAGILAGTRLSYIPFIIVPAFYLFIQSSQKIRNVIYLATGTLIWFIPMLIDTGWSGLMASAMNQTAGHFQEWGGTIQTDSSVSLRIRGIITSIYASGLGGYIPGRSFWSLSATILIIPGLVAGIFMFLREGIFLSYKVIVLSLVIYGIWIFLGQNVIYNNRHVLPMIPFITGIMAYGIRNILKLKFSFIPVLGSLLLYSVAGSYIAYRHKKPTAISMAGEYIRSNSKGNCLVISTSLINYYLKTSGIHCDFYDLDKEIKYPEREQLENYSRTFLIGDHPELLNGKPDKRKFYHNPYINPAWPEVTLTTYTHE